jgi:hypothetical protein
MATENNQTNDQAPVFPNESNIANIVGFISTFTEAPTYVPKQFLQQFVLVRAGGSTSAYIYDIVNTQWNQIGLTSI